MTVQDLTETDADVAGFEQRWRPWHEAPDKALADPHGFLAITSLHWLQAEGQRFPDAPGEWATGPDGVPGVLAEGEALEVDAVGGSGEHHFGVIPERGSVFARSGDAVIEVAKRGGHDIVRPR